MTSAAGIKKGVPVLHKEKSEFFRSFRHRHASGMGRVRAARAVIEQHGGKRAWAGGLPEKSLEAEAAAREGYDLWSIDLRSGR